MWSKLFEFMEMGRGLGAGGRRFGLGFQAWFDMFLDIRSLDLREALNNYLADFSAKGVEYLFV